MASFLWFSEMRIPLFVALCLTIGMVYSDDLCFLPMKEGFCRATIPRWFFNSKEGACKKFYYGGCYGNQNNFLNKEECKAKCQDYSCQTRYEAIGCFTHDKPTQLEYQLTNERNMESRLFAGLLIDWLRWSNYIPRSICRCAEKAARNGFKVFAIRNLAECWGSTSFTQDHKNKSSNCWDRFYGQECKTATDMCVGGMETHYYYRITNSSVSR